MNAAMYALIGALAGTAIGQIGALTIGVARQRHERSMFWIDTRRAIFGELVAAAGEFQTAASVMVRGSELLGAVAIPDEVVDRYLASADRYAAAGQAAELYMSKGALAEASA